MITILIKEKRVFVSRPQVQVVQTWSRQFALRPTIIIIIITLWCKLSLWPSTVWKKIQLRGEKAKTESSQLSTFFQAGSTFYFDNFSRWLDFREQRQMSECADAFEPAEEFETFCYKMLTEKMLDGKGWRGLRSHKKEFWPVCFWPSGLNSSEWGSKVWD